VGHDCRIKEDDWGIAGHTDWLRDYESALDTLGTELKSRLPSESLHNEKA
jgi:hypothetical protein